MYSVHQNLQGIKRPCTWSVDIRHKDKTALVHVTVLPTGLKICFLLPKVTTLYFNTWLWDDLCNLDTFVFMLVFKSAEKNKSECKRNCISIINMWAIAVYDIVVSRTLHAAPCLIFFINRCFKPSVLWNTWMTWMCWEKGNSKMS